MARGGDGLRGRSTGGVLPEIPPHRPTSEPQKVQEEAAANLAIPGRPDSRRKARRQTRRKVAVVSCGRRPTTRDRGLGHISRRRINRESCKSHAKGDDSIPEEYQGHLAFKAKHLEGLPEYGPFDHGINLKEGAQLEIFKVYHASEREYEALKKHLEENLKRGHIRSSTSPAGYLVLFVPKKNGELRMCVDYQQLDEQTVKNRYSLPLISQLRDQLPGPRIFTRLNLPTTYAHIKEKDEWKPRSGRPMGTTSTLLCLPDLSTHPLPFKPRSITPYSRS